ncbi:MAG: glycosyltransferase family 4 protein [Candidatus Woesearchaeota archaeon]
MYSVIFISLADPSGTSGQNISTKEIINALNRNEKINNLDVICPTPKYDLPVEIENTLNNNLCLPPKKNKNILWHIKSQIKMLQIMKNLSSYCDFIVVRSGPTLFVPPLISQLFDIPLFLLVRGGGGHEVVDNNFWIKIYTKSFGKVKDKFSVMISKKIYIACEEALQDLEGFLNRDDLEKKVSVFTNAVNPDLFPTIPMNKAREELDISKEAVIIGFIGSLKKRHCLLELLQAVNNLFRELDNLKIMIVGTGPEFDTIQNYIEKNNLEKIILNFGYVQHEKVYKYIAACDILYGVINPKYPSNPIKNYEALACSRPIITSKKKEFEFVKKVQCGYVIDKVSVVNIIEVIKQVYSANKSRLIKMGVRGREYVLKNHTWDILAEKLINDYQELSE